MSYKYSRSGGVGSQGRPGYGKAAPSYNQGFGYGQSSLYGSQTRGSDASQAAALYGLGAGSGQHYGAAGYVDSFSGHARAGGVGILGSYGSGSYGGAPFSDGPVGNGHPYYGQGNYGGGQTYDGYMVSGGGVGRGYGKPGVSRFPRGGGPRGGGPSRGIVTKPRENQQRGKRRREEETPTRQTVAKGSNATATESAEASVPADDRDPEYIYPDQMSALHAKQLRDADRILNRSVARSISASNKWNADFRQLADLSYKELQEKYQRDLEDLTRTFEFKRQRVRSQVGKKTKALEKSKRTILEKYRTKHQEIMSKLKEAHAKLKEDCAAAGCVAKSADPYPELEKELLQAETEHQEHFNKNLESLLRKPGISHKKPAVAMAVEHAKLYDLGDVQWEFTFDEPSGIHHSTIIVGEDRYGPVEGTDKGHAKAMAAAKFLTTIMPAFDLSKVVIPAGRRPRDQAESGQPQENRDAAEDDADGDTAGPGDDQQNEEEAAAEGEGGPDGANPEVEVEEGGQADDATYGIGEGEGEQGEGFTEDVAVEGDGDAYEADDTQVPADTDGPAPEEAPVEMIDV